MRNLRNLFAPVFALLLTTSAFASNIPENSPTGNDALRKEIAKKFSNLDLANLDLKGNSVVKIQFMVNDHNELIVLRTDNKKLDSIVKSKLNYEEVKTTDISHNRLYSINVKIVS